MVDSEWAGGELAVGCRTRWRSGAWRVWSRRVCEDQDVAMFGDGLERADDCLSHGVPWQASEAGAEAGDGDGADVAFGDGAGKCVGCVDDVVESRSVAPVTLGW